MITPDYELFVKILFVMYVLRGVVLFVVGILHIEHEQRYDEGTAVVGIILLLLALWVML